MIMWFWLLGTQLPIGLYVHISENTHPSVDVAANCIFLGVVLYFAKGMMPSLKGILRPRRIPVSSLVWILGLYLVLSAFVWGYYVVLDFFGVPFFNYLDSYQEHDWPFWSAVILICIVPAVLEEFAFRGILFQGLRELCSLSEALILQAVLFAVLHLLPLIFPSHFAIGLFFGFAAWKSHSLWPPILLHFVWNLTVLLLEKMG